MRCGVRLTCMRYIIYVHIKETDNQRSFFDRYFRRFIVESQFCAELYRFRISLAKKSMGSLVPLLQIDEEKVQAFHLLALYKSRQ